MSRVRIFFAGDFCSKPSASRIVVSERLKKLIQSCDLRVVNFEVPLRPEGVSLPLQRRERFFQNDDAPIFLRELGFNLFQLANNHAFDWGDEGFKKTKIVLGKDAFGAGSYDEAYKIKVLEVGGVRIGFMALTFSAYKGVFSDAMNHGGLGCAFINDPRVNHDIIEAKKQVDFLFVLPHDGIEYINVPVPETIARYRDFIDYGADGVVASHPHCPQGWENYKGKPIFYSLGNFLFNSKEGYDYRATDRPHWYEGLCVIMTIEAGVLSYEVINTRNIDNSQIVIDDKKDRNEFNSYLCELIHNQIEYRNTLFNECRRLTRFQEMPIIYRALQEYDLRTTIKVLVKLIFKSILHKKGNNDELELLYLLKNSTRLDVLKRGLDSIKS